MSHPTIDFTDELTTELTSRTSYTFIRRVAPYFSREEVGSGKWVVVPAAETAEIKARAVDQNEIVIDVAYQEALPDKTDTQPDPVENHPWFDANMAKIEVVKSLFRPEGDLRDHYFSNGFCFRSMENNPIYRPDLLHDYQIFTSVVRLTFVGEL